jgi:hypothetical protein
VVVITTAHQTPEEARVASVETTVLPTHTEALATPAQTTTVHLATLAQATMDLQTPAQPEAQA